MTLAKVSIIVPVYNVEKYLKRCIDSLLNQTLKNIEIILVNDDSPDNCPGICDEYSRRDGRIKVIHKKNEGLGLARNSGINMATGEYVAFVDSDDYIASDMYEKLVVKSTEDNYDIVSCGFYNINEKHTEKMFLFNTIFTDNTISEYLADMIASDVSVSLERKYSMSVWHSIYKKEILDKFNIRFASEREILSEDILFNITYISKCRKIALIPYALYFHCVDDDINSLTKKFQQSKINALFLLNEKLKQFARMKDLAIPEIRIMRFFIGYSRAMLRSIVLSNLSIQEKKILCCEIYNYKDWNDIWIQYPIRTLPVYHRLFLYGIKHQMFYLHLYIFPILLLIKKTVKS